MFNPSDGEEAITKFVVETIVKAGGNPCPPTIVGIGIGGTFEKAAIIAKEALIRPLGKSNGDSRYAALEKSVLKVINDSLVGAQGLGGSTTSFAVHIETFPCHMASLPVAINLNCHAARHASIEL
jgi:fumarate hydratase subunit alpha